MQDDIIKYINMFRLCPVLLPYLLTTDRHVIYTIHDEKCLKTSITQPIFPPKSRNITCLANFSETFANNLINIMGNREMSYLQSRNLCQIRYQKYKDSVYGIGNYEII